MLSTENAFEQSGNSPPPVKRNKRGTVLCEHGHRQYRCKKCKASGVVVTGICEHNRHRDNCKQCNGKQTCLHSSNRAGCKQCKPLGWAKKMVYYSKKTARKYGYKPAQITPEKLLALYDSSDVCVICNEQFDADITPHLHHDHDTGKVHGYAHGMCNKAEGQFGVLTLKQQVKFLQTQFPEVVKALTGVSQ